MIQELFLKVTRIEGVSAGTVNWQQRSEAFETWRRMSEARNAALLLPDMDRYRRLCLLAEVAWDRYTRRLNYVA